MRLRRVRRREALKWLAGSPALAAAAASLPRSVFAAGPAYRDAAAPVAERVADLLGRMTLEEKVAQMLAAWQDKALMMDGLEFSAAKAGDAFPDGIGQVTRVSDKRAGDEQRGGVRAGNVAAVRQVTAVLAPLIRQSLARGSHGQARSSAFCHDGR